jgi:hypothetical protein
MPFRKKRNRGAARLCSSFRRINERLIPHNPSAWTLRFFETSIQVKLKTYREKGSIIVPSEITIKIQEYKHID